MGAYGGMIEYPKCMTEKEATLYLNYARKKYGESNVSGVTLEVNGDVVEIQTRLVERPRERLRRVSPDMVKALTE